jgi:hypothetical protein
MAHIAGMYTQQSNKVYMATSYPVLRSAKKCNSTATAHLKKNEKLL